MNWLNILPHYANLDRHHGKPEQFGLRAEYLKMGKIRKKVMSFSNP